MFFFTSMRQLPHSTATLRTPSAFLLLCKAEESWALILFKTIHLVEIKNLLNQEQTML